MQFNLEITGRDRRAQPKLSKPFYYLFVYDFFLFNPSVFYFVFYGPFLGCTLSAHFCHFKRILLAKKDCSSVCAA